MSTRQRVSSLLLVFVALLAVFGSFSSGKALEGPGYYPGKLRIEKRKNLSREEREVEARFAKYLEDHTEEAIARYKEKFGKEINTDNGRELSKDYAPEGIGVTGPKTKAARLTWGDAVHEPASALVKEIYRQELKKPAGADQLNRVIFTAGGTAAGKTTAIRYMPEIANVAKYAQIIYDTTLSSLRPSIKKIEQALKAGKTVSIVYVHRDPIEALVNGVITRAEEIGRTVVLDGFLKAHIGAPKVLLHVAQRYKDDPRVKISVIDNSRGLGEAVVADLKFLEQAASKYTPKELRAKLLQALEDAYEKGKRGEKGGVSEAIYRAFKSDALKRVHGSPGSGDGKHPQLQNREKGGGP